MKETSDERIRSKSGARHGIRTPMLILGAIMCLTYLILGSYLLLDKSFLPSIPIEFRNIFAGLLLVYGFYRGYRIYSDYF